MVKRIHILGASGSGTSTLGKALSEVIGAVHLDTDHYFWYKTDDPFTEKRPREERQAMLRHDLEKYEKWILSGTLCEWGDPFIPYFDLVVYIYTPHDIRRKWLKNREKERYGNAIEPGGKRFENYNAFVEWAAKYEEGGLDMRSRKLHEHWLSQLSCPVLKLEGDLSVKERVDEVFNLIKRY